jgi:hypothetical protein
MKLFLNLVGVMLMAWVSILIGPELESKFFPVLKNFEVEKVIHEGNDVIVLARVDKVRQCRYVAPWRSRTVSGRTLQVVHEEVDAPNWTTANNIHTKIRVLATGGEAFELSAEHECHPFSTVFSKLGKVQ